MCSSETSGFLRTSGSRRQAELSLVYVFSDRGGLQGCDVKDPTLGEGVFPSTQL
jgi:hypothetical protein